MQQFKINGKIINVPSNVSFTFDESGIPVSYTHLTLPTIYSV